MKAVQGDYIKTSFGPIKVIGISARMARDGDLVAFLNGSHFESVEYMLENGGVVRDDDITYDDVLLESEVI